MEKTIWLVLINVEPPEANPEEFMGLVDAIELIKSNKSIDIDEVNGPVDDHIRPSEFAYAILSVKLLTPCSADELEQRIRTLDIPGLRNVSIYENMSLW